MPKVKALDDFRAELARTSVISQDFKNHLYVLVTRCIEEAYDNGYAVAVSDAVGNEDA